MEENKHERFSYILKLELGGWYPAYVGRELCTKLLAYLHLTCRHVGILHDKLWLRIWLCS